MMRSAHWIWLPLLALGCGGDPGEVADHAPVEGDGVAVYAGGRVSRPEIEAALPKARTPACIAARRARGGGSIDELLPCYREVAEDLVLERLVLGEIDDPEQAMRALDTYPELRRQTYLEAYHRRLAEEIEVDDEEVEAHYEANRESYRQPGSLSLWNIFRRHQDPARPEETLELLRGIKARYEAGETFAALAREVSQSETRLRDGLVGQVSEGRLPERLEKVAFALGDGDVSDPIPVRGGAVLLHVRHVTRGVDLTLADAEARIRQELRSQAVAERIAERVAGAEPPAGALVLAEEELFAALERGDPEAPILDLAGDRLTAGDLRRLAGLADGDGAADLDETARAPLLAIYEGRRDQSLLLLDLEGSADAELRAEAEERLRERGRGALVDDRLRQAMRDAAAADEETLETYYRDNRHHYQSPLRFHIRVWDVPFAADPPLQLARMEELHEALAAGRIELAEAVAELGGSVRDLGWRAFEELADLRGKERHYLLQTEAGGFSVPYQDDEALHLLYIEEREEPRPQSFEEAAEQVREDYLERFEEQLFRRLAEERLAEAGFRFDEEAVRQALVQG
jgi:parvulin-like peptidyl-prolyl isomerase